MDGTAGLGEGEATPAEANGLSAMDCAIWAVRVLLPIILFFILYRIQQPDQGPTGNCYDRDEILASRRAPEDEDPPEELLTLRLISEAQVQKVLGLPPSRGAGPGPGGRREPGGKGAKGGKGDKGGGKGKAAGRGGEATPSAARGAATSGDSDSMTMSSEERTNMESLLNFVALRCKDIPKRVFLPDDDHPPPPPPKRPSASRSPLEAADAYDAAKANMEAQLVLKGLLNPKLGFKCSEVAKAMSAQLADKNIAPSEATCSLIVEACVNAGDLKAASDFLMKMESAGHCADSQLLDKIMDLYAESRHSPTGGCVGGTSLTSISSAAAGSSAHPSSGGREDHGGGLFEPLLGVQASSSSGLGVGTSTSASSGPSSRGLGGGGGGGSRSGGGSLSGSLTAGLTAPLAPQRGSLGGGMGAFSGRPGGALGASMAAQRRAGASGAPSGGGGGMSGGFGGGDGGWSDDDDMMFGAG